jgi:DNA repair exonuclease SbcCD nuclease subunit
MIRKIDKEKSGKGGNKYEVTIFGQAVFENNAEVSQELGLFSGKIETLNELIKSLGLDKIVAQLDLLKNESNATAIITQDLTKKMKALEKEIKENVKVNSDKIKDLEKVVKKEEKFVLKELNQARELDAIVGVEDLEERKEEFRKKLRSIKRTEYKERRRASVERIKNYTLALGNAKINNHIMRVEQKMESLEKFSLKEVSERLNKMTEGNAISWPSVQTETSNFVTQLNGWEVLIKELKEFISRLK